MVANPSLDQKRAGTWGWNEMNVSRRAGQARGLTDTDTRHPPSVIVFEIHRVSLGLLRGTLPDMQYIGVDWDQQIGKVGTQHQTDSLGYQ